MQTILKCTDCPFNGQDNIYCRTCTIPAKRAAKTALRLARNRRRRAARRRRWLKRNSDYYRVAFGCVGGLWVYRP